MAEQIYEYELIDISFHTSYEMMDDNGCWKVCEDSQTPDIQGEEHPKIEYDVDGIPLGRSKVEIKMREKAIKAFYAKWISENPEKKVWNKNLILKNAQFISEQPTKANNKNQKSFSKILIMNYENIKLTVGYQTKTLENVQYSITVPQK